MTIGKKLYAGFGAILAILLLLFLVNITAVRREHALRAEAAAALEAARTIESAKFQMMQVRLALQNYLLSGDSREEQKVSKGATDLLDYFKKEEARTSNDLLRGALVQVEGSEQEWTENFAKPLIAKRHQVDSGDATVAELQIFYLQHTPGSWVGKSAATLDEASNAIRKALAESTESSA